MLTPVIPFLTTIENAKQRLEVAPDRDELRGRFTRDEGILHGFFLAGAVSIVESNAARAELRRVYEARGCLLDLQTEWRRQHKALQE